jgi:hypothetical protein
VAEWKRHEMADKHWPQRRYVCLGCFASTTISGAYSCQDCLAGFSDLEEAKEHYEHCKSVRDKVPTFTRKDKLTEHFRGKHATLLDQEGISIWSYNIDSNWPRQCGFCGTILHSWDERVEHLIDHFKKGCRISSWKLPFVAEPHPGLKTSLITPSADFEEFFDSQPETLTGGMTEINPNAILGAAVMTLVSGADARVDGILSTLRLRVAKQWGPWIFPAVTLLIEKFQARRS